MLEVLVVSFHLEFKKKIKRIISIIIVLQNPNPHSQQNDY